MKMVGFAGSTGEFTLGLHTPFLKHTTLIVDDADTLKKTYADAFSLSTYYDEVTPVSQEGSLGMPLSDAQIVLMEAEHRHTGNLGIQEWKQPVFAPPQHVYPTALYPGSAIIAKAVDDFDRAYATAAAAPSLKIIGEPIAWDMNVSGERVALRSFLISDSCGFFCQVFEKSGAAGTKGLLEYNRTNLVVQDAEASIRFYTDVLKQKKLLDTEITVSSDCFPLSAPKARIRFVLMWDENPNTIQIGLMQFLEPTLPETRDDPITLRNGSIVSVIRYRKLGDLARSVTAAGCHLVVDPCQTHVTGGRDTRDGVDTGLTTTSFCDPDGYMFTAAWADHMADPVEL